MNELTRAELIEMICPTDATYNCNQGNCSSSCDKCEDILNYLLDRYDAKVRVDAIDKCISKLDGLYSMSASRTKYPQYDHYCNGIEDCIDVLGEIKEGKE